MSRNELNEDGKRRVTSDRDVDHCVRGPDRQVAFSAGKAGKADMTLTMARDLRSRGVRLKPFAPTPSRPLAAGWDRYDASILQDDFFFAQVFDRLPRVGGSSRR